MAERRMFAKTIIDSDMFLDMPLSAQCLYFHLCMRADDDGFLNNAIRILKTVGCSNDDYRLLLAKQFIIPFENGVVVIKHWRIHNYIRSDRYKPTKFQEEKKSISVNENNEYQLMDTIGIPTDYHIAPSGIGIGKGLGIDNISSSSSKGGAFVPPTPKEVNEYAAQVGCVIDGEKFVDDFTATGWIYKGVPLQDWKAVIRSWRKNNQRTISKKNQGTDRYKATSEEMANMTANAERIDLD